MGNKSNRSWPKYQTSVLVIMGNKSNIGITDHGQNIRQQWKRLVIMAVNVLSYTVFYPIK